MLNDQHTSHSIAMHITRSSSVKKIKIVYLLEIKSAECSQRAAKDGAGVSFFEENN